MLLLYLAALLTSFTIVIISFADAFVFHSVSFYYRLPLSYAGTLVTEFAHVFLLAKLGLFYVVKGKPFWLHPIMFYLYWLDVVIALYFWTLFLQSYFTRHPVYVRTKFYRDETSTYPPHLFSISFVARFLNPLWHARGLKLQDNICYATDQEIVTMKPKDKTNFYLDILHHASFPKQRPVLVYVHGELSHSWASKSGSKEDMPPFLSYLALKRYVVVSVNYRKSKSFADQLIDVKRSIRWVRSNITKFGGDPSFIAISGASTGAHLATMCAFTPNDAKYQPGFEEIDTSVQACISINGFYDVTNHNNHFGYDINQVFRQVSPGDTDDFYREVSPTWILIESKARESAESASKIDKRGIELPPFLVVHGIADSVAPIAHVREFVAKLSATQTQVCCIELPVFKI